MAHFPTSAEAREQAQGNNVIAQQIAIIEISILDAITAGAFTTSITDTSTVSIQGSTITGSPMTDHDSLGQDYYKAFQGTTENAVYTEQMNEVINHFKSKGYTISRKSTSGSYFFWSLTW